MTRTASNAAGDRVRRLLAEEMDRIRELRDRLSLGPREDLLQLTERALRVATCPSCAEIQADGVPCDTVGTPCDGCAKALAWIHELRVSLEREEQEGAGAAPWEI